MERNGIHIIDLYKTQAKMDEAANALCQLAKSGKRVLFVATKKQAKDVVAELAQKVNMPYVTERWPGGMLTNFATIRKAVKKMTSIDKMMNSDAYKSLSKREKLQIEREREKLEKNLGSIADLSRLPSALFVVDIMKEHIAVAEARKLNIPTFAIVDTNTNPNLIDFPIPFPPMTTLRRASPSSSVRWSTPSRKASPSARTTRTSSKKRKRKKLTK